MKLSMSSSATENHGFSGRFICRDVGEMTEVLLMEGATGKRLVRAGTVLKNPGEAPGLEKLRMLVAEFYRGRALYGSTVTYELLDERKNLIESGFVQDATGAGLLRDYS